MSRHASETVRKPALRRGELLEARNLELTRTLHFLEEARANLADQYDFAPIGFVTMDARGSIREINLTAAHMLGMQRPSLLDKPLLTCVARSHCPAFLDHLQKCRTQNAEVISEVTFRTREDRNLPVELRSVPVLDPRHGETVYRTAITDITARLRAGKALQESEERYRKLVELSPDGIFIECEGAIAFANRSALRLCGVEDEQELIGRNIAEYVSPAFRQGLAAALNAASRTSGETPITEAQLVRQDETTVYVEIVARSFHYESAPAVLVLARDVTKRRKAELDVLAISERERTAFGRDVHDGVCQTLLGVAYLAEILRDKMRQISPEAAADAEEIAQIIRQCSGEARNLARGLCPVSMENNGLVAALHNLSSDITGRTRVRCTVECDDHFTTQDAGLATNLYRIAQEAVSNAIKHGRAKSVLIQFGLYDGRMTLRVRDDGKGIAVNPKDTGMGLHTMRYRAAMIGGSLDVRRDQSRGTVVTCSYPINGKIP